MVGKEYIYVDLQTKSFSGNAKQILQIFRSYTGDNQHKKYEHLKYHVTSILLHFTLTYFYYATSDGIYIEYQIQNAGYLKAWKGLLEN